MIGAGLFTHHEPTDGKMMNERADGRLANEVAIVTGGGGGIGSAIARRLSNDGAAVVIFDKDKREAEIIVGELKGKGRRAGLVQCDITRREEVRAAVARVVEAHGQISVLVNNAGIGRRASFLELSDEAWNDVLAVNLTGSFVVAQEVCRVMVRAGRGSVVNVGSVAAHIAHSEQAAYATSKAALEGLTRGMAFELAPLGVRANAVLPGTVATGIIKGMLQDEERVERERRIPFGRLAEPEEIAAVVAFLASDDARYMTGSLVVVDGGLLFSGIRASGRPGGLPDRTKG